MNNTKFSIVIPSFNSANTIAKTISSILDQKYPNTEIIIVDGDSNDSTIEILQSFKEQVKFISEPDKGIYDAMNKGINLAKGELIGIISSNDWMSENALLNIAKNYKDNPDHDIYHGNIIQLMKIGNNNFAKIRIGGNPNDLRKRMSVLHPTCFIKNEMYKKQKYNTLYKIAGDYDLLLRFFLNKASFFYINKEIVVMTHGGASNTYSTIIETCKIQISHRFYKNAFMFLIIQSFYFFKSKILRFIGIKLIPKNRYQKIEINKWGGKPL